MRPQPLVMGSLPRIEPCTLHCSGYKVRLLRHKIFGDLLLREFPLFVIANANHFEMAYRSKIADAMGAKSVHIE